MDRHRVVIVGCGFGGLFAARALRHADVDVTVIGLVDVSGFFGWLLWLAVHLYGLTGFENRIAVLANWIVAFVGRGRPQRAIAQQVFSREAFEAQATAITAAVSASLGEDIYTYGP
jgi:NADH dehydrogenase FAD-containing subunit